MSLLTIALFGRFEAKCGEQIVPLSDLRKAQELFCYLLLYRQRPHPRETLAGLLWGESSTAQSKKYLRQGLWQLNAALDESNPSAMPFLLVDADWIAINQAADLWLDVAEFEQSFARVQGIPGQQLDLQSVVSLRAAVRLYRGDLLEGWYMDWCVYERQRLQTVYLAMLDKLMAYCEARREYDEALGYGYSILRYDRAQERTHRRLMRLLYAAGDRTGALRQYERCAAALADELNVTPSQTTLSLFQAIKAERPGESGSEARGDPASRAGNPPLHPIVAQLRQIQATLEEVQQQVQNEIQALEQTLKNRG